MELEGEEKEKGTESIFKAIMAKNFPNLGREMASRSKRPKRTLNRLNLNRATLRHIITVRSQDKKIILKASREERSNIQSSPHKTVGGFLSGNISVQERMG